LRSQACVYLATDHSHARSNLLAGLCVSVVEVACARDPEAVSRLRLFMRPSLRRLKPR
jgi:hypothetical protein